MHVKVHYQGLESSPWMEDFITKRVQKLTRYLSPASMIHVHVKFANRKYSTNIAVHNHQDYAFAADGENFYESFSLAMDKANRALRESKQRLKDKINRKYFSIREIAA